MGIASINPATGQFLQSFEALDQETLGAKLKRADQVFQSYREPPSLNAAIGCITLHPFFGMSINP